MPKTKRTIYLVTDFGGAYEDAWEFPYMAFDSEQAAKECAVYHARPEVCRTYRCDKHVRGELLGFYGCDSAEVCDMYAVAGVLEMSNGELRKLADELTEQTED